VIEPIIQNMIVQFVVLGAGERFLADLFRELPARHPGTIGSYIGYSDELSHLIEAGSDFFLMPSLYEPCGLNQIYSLKYGTLPIVRATGGLDDTVQQYNEKEGTGTGFKFWEPSGSSLYYTVGWAVSTYYDRKPHFADMQQTAMLQDFSWERSALEYRKLYDRAIANKRAYDG
jgi:starch synthase